MEIHNVEYYPTHLEGDDTLNTFVLRMQTNEATIQLQCKTSTHTKEDAQIAAELLKDAKRQLAKLPKISSGTEKVFFDKELTALEDELVA